MNSNARDAPPPPPPPPHGQSPRPPGGLPDGNYDIFIIPPHSAGSGFLYLPSLQPHRNSFLAGVACTLLAVGMWTLVIPVLRQWIATVMSGGGGVGLVALVIAVAVLGWAWGKTQGENAGSWRPDGSGGSGSNSHHYQHAGGQRQYQTPPGGYGAQSSSGAQTGPNPSAANGWEKAREETRKREEERKRAEEWKKKREEAAKAREDADQSSKAKAEKEKWEQARSREKEQREREARERIARERQTREKDQREKDARERDAREQKAKSAPGTPSGRYERPTARSTAGTEEAYSYRPYDTPKAATYKSSASSISGLSESSYAPSHSTARTTPPPSQRGPYSTKDTSKIQIKAVYLFTDTLPTRPVAQLISNQGTVTDGLVLKIQSEGLFVDDDVRGVGQREWDVKAWTIKLVEDGMVRTPTGHALHVFRVSTRDIANKKYTFVLDESEAFKVAIGLKNLRGGSQTRSLHMSGIKDAEVRGLLMSLGWL